MCPDRRVGSNPTFPTISTFFITGLTARSPTDRLFTLAVNTEGTK